MSALRGDIRFRHMTWLPELGRQCEVMVTKGTFSHRCRRAAGPQDARCYQHQTRGEAVPDEIACQDKEFLAWMRARKAVEAWRERRSVVYFLVRYDEIKIGTTWNLATRMADLNHALDDVLGTVCGGPAVERAWHKRFAHLRVRGEWFRANDALLQAISDAVEGDRDDKHG